MGITGRRWKCWQVCVPSGSSREEPKPYLPQPLEVPVPWLGAPPFSRAAPPNFWSPQPSSFSQSLPPAFTYEDPCDHSGPPT